MTDKEAGEIVRGIIHGYIGPDHRVMDSRASTACLCRRYRPLISKVGMTAPTPKPDDEALKGALGQELIPFVLHGGRNQLAEGEITCPHAHPMRMYRSVAIGSRVAVSRTPNARTYGSRPSCQLRDLENHYRFNIDLTRNERQLMHGDWDEVRGLIGPLMLRTAFETVSGLFERLEKKIYPD